VKELMLIKKLPSGGFFCGAPGMARSALTGAPKKRAGSD